MRTLTDDLREIDEGIIHATRSMRSFLDQGQMRMAEIAERKRDTLLELRLLVTQMSE